MGEQTMAPEIVRHFVSHADDFDRIDAELWQPISIATIARSAPQFGETVLDACCGTGASAVPTAELVGISGLVDAVDLAAPMIAKARRRAGDDAGERMPQLQLHVGDALAWPKTGYDLVQCVLGVFFFPDVEAGLRALIERTRPGGRLAVTVWHEGAFHAFDQTFADAVAAEAGEAAVEGFRTRDTGRVPSTTGATSMLLHGLGLERVHADDVPRRLPLDGDLAWRLVLGTSRHRVLESLSKKVRKRLRERFPALLAERGIDHVDVSTVTAVGFRPAD